MNTNYKITAKESQTISIYKLLLTVLVVFLHAYNDQVSLTASHETLWFGTLQHIISQIIARCAVPAFFLLSGILLYRKDFKWKDNMIKKVRSLLVPYLILNTFWIIFYAIVQKISFLSRFFSQPENIVANWTLTDWIDKYVGFSDYPILYPLWFVRDLFILNLLAIIIKKLVDRFPKIIFIILIATLVLNLKTGLFFMTASNTVFFILGYYIVKYNVSLEHIDKIKLLYILPIYALSILLDFVTRNIGMHYLFRNISIFVGILFWAKISFSLMDTNRTKLILKLCKYSFFIYCFHEMNLRILKKIMASILPTNVYSLAFQYFSIPIVIIICCIVLAVILEKYFSPIYKIITGARTK